MSDEKARAASSDADPRAPFDPASEGASTSPLAVGSALSLMWWQDGEPGDDDGAERSG